MSRFHFLLLMLVFPCIMQAQTLESILKGYHAAIGGLDKYPQQNAVIIKAQTQGGGGGQKRPMTFTLKHQKVLEWTW